MIFRLKNEVEHRLKIVYRQATYFLRSLPSFVIIGAQKSGTTSLYHYLSQHPQLEPSYKKEVHFFDGGPIPDVDSFNKGPAWYRSHFRPKKLSKNDQISFEASPLYLFNPLVPQRISRLIPEVKLIAILRNPTERAISHYFHEVRGGRESLPLMDALKAEEERLKPIMAKKNYKSRCFINHSYKSRGNYYEQIKRYLNYFPMSNLLVLNSETLFNDPYIALKRVFEFVGVDSDFIVKDLSPRKVGSNKSKVGQNVIEYLDNYFRFPNQMLSELIGKEYDW